MRNFLRQIREFVRALGVEGTKSVAHGLRVHSDDVLAVGGGVRAAEAASAGPIRDAAAAFRLHGGTSETSDGLQRRFQRLFEGELYGRDQLRVEVVTVSRYTTEDPMMRINLDVYGSSQRVGRISHTVRTESDDRLIAQYHGMSLDPTVRGRGFEEEFLVHANQVYGALGVREIRYWAPGRDSLAACKAGFRFDRSSSSLERSNRREISTGIEVVRRRVGTSDADKASLTELERRLENWGRPMPEVTEIVTWGGRTSSIGVDVLETSMWSGIKEFQPVAGMSGSGQVVR